MFDDALRSASEQVCFEMITRWKLLTNLEWAVIQTFYCMKMVLPIIWNKNVVFFNCSILQTLNGWLTMKWIINRGRYSIIRKLFHKCIKYWHAGWLVWEWNVKLHCIGWYLYIKMIFESPHLHFHTQTLWSLIHLIKMLKFHEGYELYDISFHKLSMV